jgi:hypothetical protein
MYTSRGCVRSFSSLRFPSLLLLLLNHLARISTRNPTTMATETGFKRIPAELRNQIYEDFIPTCAEHRFIKLDKLDQAACKNPWELALALGLKPFFPLLFASKQILDEALPFCLQTCDLYVRNLSHLEALEEVQYLPTFRKIANHIRALTLDLTPKEKPAPPRIIPASWDDLPPLRTHVEGACKPNLPTAEFTALLEELKNHVPNVSTLHVLLDEPKLHLHEALRLSLPGVEWSSLRLVRVRRADLDREIAAMQIGILLENPHAVWPPYRIPWGLEMDYAFLEHVNEQLAELMSKRVKGDKVVEKAGQERQSSLSDSQR